MNLKEEPTTLSSELTLFMQIVFGVTSAAIFSWFVINTWIHWDTVRSRSGAPVSAGLKWALLGAWIPYLMFVYCYFLKLKRVRLSGRYILISNYFKEIRIPIEDIVDVTSNKWMNHHPTIIHFRHSTEFGNKISFLPKIQFCGLGRNNPIVDDLRRIAGGERCLTSD